MKIVIFGVTIILIFFAQVPLAFSSQPILDEHELLELVNSTVQGITSNDLRDVNYMDMTGDNVPELLVGIGLDQTHRGHFLAYSFRNGRYENVLRYTWRNSYFGIAFEHVWFKDQVSTLAVIRYSPQYGTGWLPIWRDVVWWDGESFRTVWSGRTDLFDMGSLNKETMVNSLLNFSYDNTNPDIPVLEVLSIERVLSTKGVPGRVKSTTVERYVWDDKALAFVRRR